MAELDFTEQAGLPPVRNPLILDVLADAGIPPEQASVEVRVQAAVAASNRTVANRLTGLYETLEDIASMSGGTFGGST